MKRIFRILRITAKILLVVLPLVLVTGLLTAKPYLLESSSFQLYRTLHTLIVPFIFLPLLYIHSLSGILLMIQRNQRWNKKWVRWTAGVVWTTVLASLALLFLVSPPAVEDTFIDEDVAYEESGYGPGSISEEDAAPRADAGTVDAVPGPEVGDGGRDATGEEEADGSIDSAPLPDSTTDSSTKSGVVKRVKARPRKSRAPELAAESLAPPVASPPLGADTSVAEPVAPPAEKTAPKLSGSALVRERCTLCHGLETVYGKQRTAVEWRGVIARMRAQGAQLDANEQAAVIGHLLRRAE